MLKRGVLVFQGHAPTSRMAGPPKPNSDASDSGQMAANKAIKLTRVVPSHEEHSRLFGTIEQLGSTNGAATSTGDAVERSAIRYDLNCIASRSYLSAPFPNFNLPLGILGVTKVGWA
jgi:hypothetical protein